MLTGFLGISPYKVAAMLFGACLVQKAAWKTCKTFNKQMPSATWIDNVASCPCDKRVKVKVCTEALWYDYSDISNALVVKTKTV
jgi:hypothetical protein